MKNNNSNFNMKTEIQNLEKQEKLAFSVNVLFGQDTRLFWDCCKYTSWIQLWLCIEQYW